MKILLASIAMVWACLAQCANPAFSDFDLSQFNVTANKVHLKSGALATNLTVVGEFYVSVGGTNYLEYDPGASDGEIPYTWDTKNLLTTSKMFQFKNAGTNFWWIGPNGEIAIGVDPELHWGPIDNGETIVSVRQPGIYPQEPNYNEIYVSVAHDIQNYSSFETTGVSNHFQTTTYSFAGGLQTHIENWVEGSTDTNNPSVARVAIKVDDTVRTRLEPSHRPSDGTPYFFDTEHVFGSGNLFELANNGTNKVYGEYNGTLHANSFVVSGTTNQIVFGATNSAPVDSATIKKWISVQVQGESTVYRTPLYQ